MNKMKKCNADDELRRENSMGGHSSIGRATDSKSVGWEFESLWPHPFFSLKNFNLNQYHSNKNKLFNIESKPLRFRRKK